MIYFNFRYGSMHVQDYVCIYLYMHAYIKYMRLVYACVCEHVYVSVCTYVFVCAYIRMHVYGSVCLLHQL